MAGEDSVVVQLALDAQQSITALAGFARGIAGLAGQVARMAHEANETEDAIRQLGGAYDRVAQATSGAVSAAAAFRTQQQLQEAGIEISGEGLAVLTRRAREYANATQTDLQTSLDRVTSTIIRGSAPALERLGVHLDRSTRGSRASAEAIRQWRDQQRGVAPEAQNLEEAADANARAWNQFANSMANSAAQAINLRQRLAEVREATTGLGEVVGNALAALGIGAGGAETQRRNQERQLEQLRAGIAERVAQQGGGRVTGLDRLTTAQLYALRDRVDRAQGAEAMRAATGQASEQGGAAIAADTATATAAAQGRGQPLLRGGGGDGGGGGGGGGSNPLREAVRAAAALRREAEAAGMLDTVDDLIQRRPGESGAAWKRRLELLGPGIQQAIQEETASRSRVRDAATQSAQRTAEFNQRQAESRDRQLEGARTRGAFSAQQGTLAAQMGTLSQEARAQLMEQRRTTGQDITSEGIRAVRAANDVGEQLQSTFRRTQTFAQNVSGAVGAAFESMTSSLTSHITALVEGRENIGQAMLGIAHEVSMGIATRSLPLAIFELASGVAAQAATLGAPNPISVQHFASAAMFGSLAAGGFIVGAATGAGLAAVNAASQPAGGGAASTGTGLPNAPASTGRLGGQNGGGNTVIQVNFNGAPMHTMEDLQAGVAAAANIARTRGFAYDAEIMQRRREAA